MRLAAGLVRDMVTGWTGRIYWSGSICLGRWAHLITGIAWIGASFYFVWLDNQLAAPEHQRKDTGVGGEVWSVHGGGFYHAQKYAVAPPALPETLHWFKWEAYTTWLSGFVAAHTDLLVQAEIYLIDPRRDGPAADGRRLRSALGCLAGGWIVYDLLCRSPLGENETLLAGSSCSCCSVRCAWGLCHCSAVAAPSSISARCSAPSWSANVFVRDHAGAARAWCRPSRRAACQRSDPRRARQAAQRAQHLFHPAGAVRDDQQPLRR